MPDNRTGHSIDLTTLRGFIKGKSGTGVSEQLPDGTLTGDHMRIKLEQVLVGVELANWKGEVTRLDLVRVLYENLTDYLMPTQQSGTSVMVDSEGFQHPESIRLLSLGYEVVDGVIRELRDPFKWPQLKLEGGAKTRGWVAFEAPDAEVLPQRFSFEIRLFEPGSTSGWIRGTETFVFELPLVGN
jgi:hypothetical protein